MAELSAVELGEGPISIEVDGEFDLADEERAQELIDRALESSAPLLIDLTTCSFMDSTGLRILLRTHMRAQTGGLRFAIAARISLTCMPTLPSGWPGRGRPQARPASSAGSPASSRSSTVSGRKPGMSRSIVMPRGSAASGGSFGLLDA